MTRMLLALLASATLSAGCAAKQAVILDPSLPHRVAREGDLVVWLRLPDGSYSASRVRVPEGWWVASPIVVEGKP